MDSWIPLFEIFLNSPTPETQASQWLQQSFNSSSISTSSFLSLLTKPCNLISSNSISTPSQPTRVMYIQTLPSMVQSRILSFLLYESNRFCARDLSRLARGVLGDGEEVDFWVKRAACNLLDVVCESSYEWISGLNLDSVGDDGVEGKFGSLPDWVKDKMGSCELAFPWLPLTGDRVGSRDLFERFGEDSLSQVGETEEEEEEDDKGGGEYCEEVVQMKVDCPGEVCSDPELERMAASLKARVASFESTSNAVDLAKEIRAFCLERGGDSFILLGMIEAWRADDETAAVLISHLSQGNDNQLGWPSHILCSIVLPKLLVLEVPVSRVLLTAVLEFCKLNQSATVYALLFPLILRKEGINNSLCDIITRILKECLHPGHVSAFCHKLLCGEQDERRIVCLPCHKQLISEELIWTESLFHLFQNIMNYNVHLTQDSVDNIVYQVQLLAERFSNSLKFGKFLLCLVMKCPLLLRAHKLSLIEAVNHTNTLMTKSLLSKLDAL